MCEVQQGSAAQQDSLEKLLAQGTSLAQGTTLQFKGD